MKSKILFLAYEFVYGGHLLSLGASCIIMSVILIFGLKFSLVLFVIPYLLSQFVYSFNHYKELGSDLISNPERSKHIAKNYNKTRFITWMYILILVPITLMTNYYTAIVIMIIAIAGMLYTLYFKRLSASYFAGFKNLYTSLFWGLLVFLVPAYYSEQLSLGYISLGIFIVLRLIVNTVFFDIKDIESDKAQNLKTFPVVLGKQITIIILSIINLLALIPLVLAIVNEYIPIYAFILMLLALYSFVYLFKSLTISEKSMRTLSYIVVDGEYIFWPILIVLGMVMFELL